jgi:hypothetical protein
MKNARRNLTVLLAATFHVAIGVTLASAQTVVVRRAMPGATVELVLNGTPAGTAQANTQGIATVAAAPALNAPIDANVWVEACGETHRVIVARRSAPPVADPVCRRTQIEGLFLVQGLTSIVVDLRGPSLLMRQGSVPGEWLQDPVQAVAGEPDAPEPPRPSLPPLTGLMLFGGVERALTSSFASQYCGDVTSCSDSPAMQYNGGVAWWFTDFLAAEGRYTYLGKSEVEGSGGTFGFTTTREGSVLALAARAGVRAGRVRPFARGGMGFHKATVTTSQTVNETTAVIDGVTQTIPGGTQIMQMRTSGWAPVYGGGVEIWFSQRIGIYGEVQRIGLKGADDRGADLETDDALTTVQAGVTIRFP